MKNKNFLILSLPLLIFLTGCATEYNLATGQQETLMYGTEKEVKIGDAVARQVESQFDVVGDVAINQRVEAIMDRISAVADRRDLVYTIRVLDDDAINAVSLPGGYVYLFKGLVDKVKSDDELAGVIAHEVGHITAKHALKRLQASYGFLLLQVAAMESGSSDAVYGVNVLYTTVFLAYSRQDEYEADRLAVKYTQKAGYDPAAMRNVLELLKEENAKHLRPISYFRTHPYMNERIAALNKEIQGHMKFRDYLNLTGNEL